MKLNFHFKFNAAIWLAIFLFSFLGSNQDCKAQWWKDTVWTKATDQSFYYMLKFSKNDSIIVAHNAPTGVEVPLNVFFDAKTGKEITRISGNNEVFFINNDKNFIRLNEVQKRIEIFDANSYQLIDTLENDEKTIGRIDISLDERYIAGVVSGGLRTWDIKSKKIISTKIFPEEENLISIGFANLRFTCDNSKIIGQLGKVYKDPKDPNKTINVGYFGVYDFNTLDSIDRYKNGQSFTISNNCKYIAYKVGDMYNGVEVYDFNTKELLWKIPVNGPSLTGIEFSPDDKFLVTSPTITIWNIEKKEKVYIYSSGSSNNIALSNEGKYIVNSIGNYTAMFFARWDGNSIYLEPELLTTIYPNPTTNSVTLNFELKNPLLLNYSIYNETGQIIKPLLIEFTNKGTITKTFDVSDLPFGTYFLKITGGKFSLTFKVMKMR